MSYQTETWQLDPDHFLSAEVQERIRLFDERSRQLTLAHLPLTSTGWCGACQALRPIQIRADHGTIDDTLGMVHLAYSETAVCLECKINSRARFAAELVRQKPQASRIYLTEHMTALRMRLALRFPNIYSSEYLGDHEPGSVVDGIRHEDLHNLSFADGMLDAVLCLDVLEHVNDPLRCLQEMERVLAPGGTAIVTFPFFAHREHTVRRSELRGQEIHHLLPAEYHGNPLGGGSLVFTEISWDFLREALDEIPGSRFIQYFSSHALHLGGWRFALLIDKP